MDPMEGKSNEEEKSKFKLLYGCKYCIESFDTQQKADEHSRYCEENPSFKKSTKKKSPGKMAKLGKKIRSSIRCKKSRSSLPEFEVEDDHGIEPSASLHVIPIVTKVVDAYAACLLVATEKAILKNKPDEAQIQFHWESYQKSLRDPRKHKISKIEKKSELGKKEKSEKRLKYFRKGKNTHRQEISNPEQLEMEILPSTPGIEQTGPKYLPSTSGMMKSEFLPESESKRRRLR